MVADGVKTDAFFEIVKSQALGPGSAERHGAIDAMAGEQLKIVLKNIGTLPKEAMGHNWVLLKPGTDLNAFAQASMAAAAALCTRGTPLTSPAAGLAAAARS